MGIVVGFGCRIIFPVEEFLVSDSLGFFFFLELVIFPWEDSSGLLSGYAQGCRDTSLAASVMGVEWGISWGRRSPCLNIYYVNVHLILLLS